MFFRIGLVALLLMLLTGMPAWADPNSDLENAIRSYDLEGVREALSHGANVNQGNRNGKTPLWGAASLGFADVVNLLLSSGANVNQPDNNGRTPLWVAASKGHANVLKILLAQGTNVNQLDNDGNTPLEAAVWWDHAEAVKTLLAYGANVNQPDSNGNTPLFETADQGYRAVAKILLSHGAKVNLANTNGVTPLWISARNGHADVSDLLLSHGANVNQPDNDNISPLWIAVNRGHAKAVKILLAYGATPSREDFDAAKGKSKTLLRMAIKGQTHLSPSVDVQTTKTPPTSPPQNLSVMKEMLAKIQAEIVAGKSPDKVLSHPHFDSLVDRPSFHLTVHRNRYAVVVGVEHYRKGTPDAKFADRDAEAVKANLVALGYPSSHIRLLEDEYATRSSIREVLKSWLPRNVPKDGVVLFYFAGHGGTDPNAKTAYLVPWDGQATDLPDTALSVIDVEKDLGRLPVSHVLLVADACYSGAGGRSVLAPGTRPLTMHFRTPFTMHYKHLTVFTASRGNQISGDLPKQGHGIFTYYFLQGLEGRAKKDGVVTLESLDVYLSKTVPRAFRRRYGSGEQNPVLYGEKNEILVRY